MIRLLIPRPFVVETSYYALIVASDEDVRGGDTRCDASHEYELHRDCFEPTDVVT